MLTPPPGLTRKQLDELEQLKRDVALLKRMKGYNGVKIRFDAGIPQIGQDAAPGGSGGGDSSIFFCRITGGDETTGYDGEEVDWDTGTNTWVAVSGGATFAAAGRRASSEDYDPPLISVGQVVLAEESALSPGEYKLTAWGSQLRYTQKVYIGSYCDAGNIVNVYRRIRVYARDLCKTPGSPGDAE